MRVFIAAAALLVAPSALAAPTPAPSKQPAPSTQPAPKPQDKRYTALSARVILKVADPTKARRALLTRVKELQGRPSLITDHQLRLRVPPAQLPRLLDDLAKLGVVIDKQLTRRDVTEPIARLRGRLRSKAGILGQLRGFLDDSGVGATLQIERTMTRLVSEIERIKGRLGLQLDRARFAMVQVDFRFNSPARLRYVRSPFSWIDSVDIGRFLRGF